MPPPFIPLSLLQFADVLRDFKFTRDVKMVHVHHTWRPNHAEDEGLASIEAMYRYHTKTKGWSDIAQHITIDSQGVIWTGRGWNRTPASAEGYNTGAFMYEMIGDFDKNKDPFSGKQKDVALNVTALVLARFKLDTKKIRFHREFTDQKTCPGTSLSLIDFRKSVGEINLAEIKLDKIPIGFMNNAKAVPEIKSPIEAAKAAKVAIINFIASDNSPVSEEEANAEPDCS